ncbi:hypothetical protein ACRAWC_08525 [Leifsonia sp. L25]|uniref:hypothetical protein n=1 Tax=Actinomycetes TaxID=1760 RepID=UPI003D693B93
MPFFRRQPRRVPMRPFDEAGLQIVQPATVERALEEGMLLADFSVRMTVRNAIITEMLTTENAVFAQAPFVHVARGALLTLADDADATEARVAAERRFAAVLEGEPEHSHDYRSADSINLQRRQALSRATADELRRRSRDGEYLAHTVEQARAEAWAEISREIELRIDRTSAAPDPVGMSERLDELRQELRRLAERED